METPDREAPDREAPDREAPESGSRELYDRLREKGQELAAGGELKEALEAFDLALAWAEEHGDQVDRDRAFCNRCSAQIFLGQEGDAIPQLQRLLMRSSDLTNRWLAAAVISEGYYERHDFERSQSYARQALGYALQVGAPTKISWAHNQLGNVLVQDSRFAEALERYSQAFELCTEDRSPEVATILANMGGCDMMIGDLERGFRRVFSAWRMAIRLRIRWGQILGRIHICLCYGYLELERYRQAERHAWAGLRIAEERSDSDLRKKTLYLLGEATKQGGDEFQAFEHFSRLQREFYPQHPFLTDDLMNIDTRQLVNLWA